MTHDELERLVTQEGRPVLLALLQDRMHLRALRERRRDDIVDDQGTPYRTVELGHQRTVGTIFGQLTIDRLAYRHRGQPNLYAADAQLNLPDGGHSLELRRLAAYEVARGSFDQAHTALLCHTGQRIGKRQLEQLARRDAADVDAFYAQGTPHTAPATDVLVLTADGTGITVRPDALRPATAKAAAKAAADGITGPRPNRARMAEVVAVYDLTPEPRTAADIIAPPAHRKTTPAPTARDKWLTASITDDLDQVIAAGIAEGLRRDPGQKRPWVALVDGNHQQIDAINSHARAHGLTIPILIDLLHVLGYLHDAAVAVHHGDRDAARPWTAGQARQILDGKAKAVAAVLTALAADAQLTAHQRRPVDACVSYLTNLAPYLDYPTALTRGWPIATGVIEGACRWLVKDRMAITGAKWGLGSAEAVLKLHALLANDDFEEYWAFHTRQEQLRLHTSRYSTPTRTSLGPMPLSLS